MLAVTTSKRLTTCSVSLNSLTHSIPPATLRQSQTEIVEDLVVVSYAIGVLSLDIEILSHSISLPSEDSVQSLVDGLPGILASGWVERRLVALS